ncbi:unnamed protein product [Caretta caretta]
MAAQVWSLPFLLHWAVLSGTLTLGWAEGPCEKQFRIRQEGPGAEGRAGSPVQVVMVCGVAVAVLYSLIKAVASDPECEEEEEAEEAQSEPGPRLGRTGPTLFQQCSAPTRSLSGSPGQGDATRSWSELNPELECPGETI